MKDNQKIKPSVGCVKNVKPHPISESKFPAIPSSLKKKPSPLPCQPFSLATNSFSPYFFASYSKIKENTFFLCVNFFSFTLRFFYYYSSWPLQDNLFLFFSLFFFFCFSSFFFFFRFTDDVQLSQYCFKICAPLRMKLGLLIMGSDKNLFKFL